MNRKAAPQFFHGRFYLTETSSFARVSLCSLCYAGSWNGKASRSTRYIKKTRIALLGTLADLHKQPICYDLGALKCLVSQTQPDMLGVEVERDEFEREDLANAPVEVGEALIPLAQKTDIVLVPIGAGSKDELRAPAYTVSAALIRALDGTLTAFQKTAGDARRVNSPFISETCGIICHLEQNTSRERGRHASESTNAKMLANIVSIAQRDPHTRILVAVQCRRKHWLEPRLRQVSEIELVNY